MTDYSKQKFTASWGSINQAYRAPDHRLPHTHHTRLNCAQTIHYMGYMSMLVELCCSSNRLNSLLQHPVVHQAAWFLHVQLQNFYEVIPLAPTKPMAWIPLHGRDTLAAFTTHGWVGVCRSQVCFAYLASTVPNARHSSLQSALWGAFHIWGHGPPRFPAPPLSISQSLVF